MAAPVRTGEELEVTVDSLAYGGNGVGRVNGFVVFVRGGLPGDRVRARVLGQELEGGAGVGRPVGEAAALTLAGAHAAEVEPQRGEAGGGGRPGQLGGDDVDACLERWVMSAAGLPDALLRDERFVSRLKARCEAAKRALGPSGAVPIAFQHESHSVDLMLHAEEFERLIQPVLERLRQPVETAIRDARIGTADLSAIVLAGGSSRLHAVRQLVTRMFGTQRPDVSIDVQEIHITRSTLDRSAEGEVTGVTGSHPEVRFMVGDMSFLASEWTRFAVSGCDALVPGQQLRVRGVLMTDGVTVLATYVEPFIP